MGWFPREKAAGQGESHIPVRGWWHGGAYALSISTGMPAGTARASFGDHSHLQRDVMPSSQPPGDLGLVLHLSRPPPCADLEKGPAREGSCMPFSGPHSGAGTLPPALLFTPPQLSCSGHDLAVRLGWGGSSPGQTPPKWLRICPLACGTGLSLSLSLPPSNGKVEAKDGGGVTTSDPGDTLPRVPPAPPALQASPTCPAC